MLSWSSYKNQIKGYVAVAELHEEINRKTLGFNKGLIPQNKTPKAKKTIVIYVWYKCEFW